MQIDLFLSLAMLVAGAQAHAQQNRPADVPKPVAEVSFTLFHNRVYVPVEINGRKTVEMILDTGAAMSGLSEPNAQTLHLQQAKKAQLTGNGESHLKIGIAKDISFRVGGVELLEKSVAIVPFKDLEAHEGRNIGGVLGIDLFRRYVVVIDYAARTMALYEPQSFVHHGVGEVVPLQIGHGAAVFHASIVLPDGEAIPADLAVDLGTYSALRLYRPFVDKHKFLETQGTTLDSFGFGLGGEFAEKLGRINGLQIGGLTLKLPTVSFSEAKSGATSSGGLDGTIGGGILSRFTVTLDYPHGQMILESNMNFSDPFPADTSGLILWANDPDFKTISVLHVAANTPAARTGIREWDILLSVNQQQAATLGVDGVRHLLTKPNVYHVELQRRHQTIEVEMMTDRQLY